jgi:hypothetical protein
MPALSRRHIQTTHLHARFMDLLREAFNLVRPVMTKRSTRPTKFVTAYHPVIRARQGLML